MSMRFTPFYGYSVKDSSGLNYQENKKLTDLLTEVIAATEEDDDDSFPSYDLYMADEFDEYTDYVYGIETYDINEDMKKFDKLNSGDKSFVNAIQAYYDYASTKLNNPNIKLLEDYLERIKNTTIVAKIHQVYI